MIKNIKSFFSNEDFYNPLADSKKSLLSLKEKIKGKVLPYAGLALLGAVSAVLAATTSGMIYIPLMVAAIPAMTLGITELKLRYKHRQRGDAKKFTAYDMNTAEGRDKFVKAFPSKPDFASDYLALAKKMGFATAPVFYTEPGLSAYSTVSSLLPDGKPVVVMGNLSVKYEAPEELLGTAAHELGHLQKGHSKKTGLVTTLSGLTTTFAPVIGYGVLFGTGGWAVAGAMAIWGAGFAVTTALVAKISQYHEREADRIALIETGMPEVLTGLERYTPKWEKEPKGLKEHFKKAVASMKDAHPFSHTRANYGREFVKANEEYCKETSKPFRHAVPKAA